MSESTQNGSKKDKFLQSGFIIDERFEIKEPIRKTSGCIVYRAFDLNYKIDKALLIVPPIIQVDFEAMDNLRESAKLLKWLNHQYIARFYGLHTSGEIAYFEMEFVAGKSIKRKKYESPERRFSENMAKWAALQMLEALSHAHNQNLLHRNIKPQKIIFTSNGQVRLIDFGVSEAVRNAMSMVRDMTSRSAILFMPPEQIKGKRLSIQSDIYSVGATLYYLLEGKPPFYHGDIHYQIINEKPEPIEGISQEFNQILHICLAKDINDRYESCDQMIAEIKKIRGRNETELLEVPITNIEEDEQVVEEKNKPMEVFEDLYNEEKIFFNHLTEKIQANKSILLWTGLLFIIVIVSLLYNTFIYSDTKDNSSLVNNSDQSKVLNDNSKKMIAALNDAAEVHFNKNRLIKPNGNNAYELYREVLKIDPNEKHAKTQIEAIKSSLYKEIKTDINNAMLLEAENLLSLSLEFFDDEKAFKNLEDEIESKLDEIEKLPVVIEILNGVGEGGIARILAVNLRDNNYKVEHMENYRVNGQINWGIKKTIFIGSIPKNKRIKNLEKLLNLNYKREVLKNKQSKLANVLIVLGQDYKEISIFKN